MFSKSATIVANVRLSVSNIDFARNEDNLLLMIGRKILRTKILDVSICISRKNEVRQSNLKIFQNQI